MFERFTDRARRVVVLAQEESRLLGHNYIGTEHILLGLIRLDEGVAAEALESLDISLEAVRSRVEAIIGEGREIPAGHIPFTPRAKKVLELSLREALQLGHNYIGTEHILLGLIREGEGVAAQVLVELGADLDSVRSAVIDLLGSGPAPRRRPRGPMGGAPVGTSRFLGAAPMRHCAFCGRDLWEVERYVRGETGAICDVCIDACWEAVRGAVDQATRAINLPPRVFGADPEDPAVTGIVQAFRAVFGPTTDEARSAHLEDGEELVPYFAQARDRTPGIHVTDVHVERLRSTGDEAEVRFALVLGDESTRIPLEGRAVRRGDRWLVTRNTVAHMLGLGGVRIPPKE